MKRIILSLFLCALLVQGGIAICGVPIGSSGQIVIQFVPTPAQTIATLPASTTLSGIVDALQTAGSTATTVINRLLLVANLFTRSGASCRWYWVSNEAYCDNIANNVIEDICGLFGNLIPDIKIPILLPPPEVQPASAGGGQFSCSNTIDGTPWGLFKIQAPQTWASGFNGEGIRAANIDTGVHGTHVELRDNRCPGDSWFDPYNISPDVPSDTDLHGTHTMATVVGKTVGVAPGACWMACRGGDENGFAQEELVACGQFMACPNQDNDCVDKPHVINNSYGGGSGITWLDRVMETWKNMGIAYFFSAGNSGPDCGTVLSPADHNPTEFSFLSVGAADCDDNIAVFSSKGPSPIAGYSGGLGVQISAPGVAVRSASSAGDDVYEDLQGTSMACPHVTGAAAVILSRQLVPPADLYSILITTANRQRFVVVDESCNATTGFDSSAMYPNNVYGYGRLDLLAATSSMNFGRTVPIP